MSVGSGSSRISAAAKKAAFVVLLLASPALAQTNSVEPTALGSTLSADLIRDLPTSDNLFLLVETTQPTLITDRFLGGGLYAGQPARVGGFLSSWTQTLFRIDDVSVTDPSGSGAPLLFPSLAFWRAVDIRTGMLGAEIDAVGLAISLEPRRPTGGWESTLELTTSHFGSSPAESESPMTPPPIARLDGWDRATILASGPIIPNRLGLVAAGSVTRAAQFARAETVPVTSDVASALAHLVFTPTRSDEIRTIGWLQYGSAPFEHRLPFGQPAASITETAGHAQSTWDHGGPGELPLRFFASYTRRGQFPTYDPSTGVAWERLSDGPVPALASISTTTVHRWSVGGRIGGPARTSVVNRHTLQAGIAASGGGSRGTSFYSGEARETVDSRRARIWRFENPDVESFRHEIGFAAYASDRVMLTPRLTLDTALRYDFVSAAADGGTNSINWAAVLPRAALRWTIGGTWEPTLFAGYSRSAYRLPLDWLAFGDPAAPTAEVFRWDTPETATSPLVARTGPGTDGNPEFVRIDPDLRRPRAGELVIGIDVRPSANLRLRITGIARNEDSLVGLVNVGAPAYALGGVFDPGGNVGNPEDDRLVPVYNRLPESFGRDRYVLTNLDLLDSAFEGIELSAELTKERMTLLVGATAGRAETSAASRGFGPLENDQGLVGELGADPNAGTFARGRPFTDRAYTAKVVGVFRFPTATTLGLVARYQDGQPFARMLVQPSLNQGTEAVRAFASGDSRFMFTGTLDARLQQRLGRFAIVLDAYNLLGLSYSVEERTTEAPDVRVTTAVQPPRTVHLGLRLTF